MQQPTLRIRRGNGTPPLLSDGELLYDKQNKNFYLGVEKQGVTTNVIIAGEGTFAKKTHYNATPPTSPLESDRWIDTTTFRVYEFLGGAWVETVS
jgi:hypothetical protein